ncbi:hypothetical protein [Rhizobium sp. C4]|uniref:hypothetical protein n=1 Tax=Rhizobium sp. C4 TaxID=1349800 RepID=UPI001E29E233|nr:hypothetical protein [Rhizobium sp. C4]MCD2171365.1 hypothetical protein [Rhizobium sp. C4]
MQVKTAMIVMAIMGCDDSATKCTQLSLSEPKWETVAACDKDSEQELARYSNVKYPMVIAICQSPEVTKADAMKDNTAPRQQPQAQPALPPTAETAAKEPEKPNLLQRTFGVIKEAIPTTEGVKSAVTKPVHVIADGYSWVVRKIKPD